MRANRLEEALMELIQAYTHAPEVLETQELWDTISDAYYGRTGVIKARKLNDLATEVWRKKYADRTIDRSFVNGRR